MKLTNYGTVNTVPAYKNLEFVVTLYIHRNTTLQQTYACQAKLIDPITYS